MSEYQHQAYLSGLWHQNNITIPQPVSRGIFAVRLDSFLLPEKSRNYYEFFT
jgi:hypothetical protein